MDGTDSVLSGVTQLLDTMEIGEATVGEFDDVAHRLFLARRLLSRANEVVNALQLQLSDLMPDNAPEIPVLGVGVIRRTRSRRSTWRDQQASKAMRHDISVAVARRVGQDQFTGEIDNGRRDAALAAVKEVWEIIPAPSGMKQGAQAYGLDAEDYRATTWVNGVEIVPFPAGVGDE